MPQQVIPEVQIGRIRFLTFRLLVEGIAQRWARRIVASIDADDSDVIWRLSQALDDALADDSADPCGDYSDHSIAGMGFSAIGRRGFDQQGDAEIGKVDADLEHCLQVRL